MPRSRKRSVCPVACSLDMIGDKWTLLVVRDMLAGKTLFGDFLSSPEGIATNTLADRLDKLVALRLAETKPSSHRAGAMSYHLTPRGRSLRPVLESIMRWGLQHIDGTKAMIHVDGDE